MKDSDNVPEFQNNRMISVRYFHDVSCKKYLELFIEINLIQKA